MFALLLIVAAWLRLHDLGALGLQVDEGVQALAVRGWLSTHLPILPSGLIYERAIPFGLLQAASALGFGLNELALRLPAALFGMIAVAVTFALAQGFFDRRVAWAAAVFIALSAWEIELSRYGRSYTAFQVTYCLSLLCLFRGFAPRAWGWRAGFVAAALAAISLHELAIVLATCFLIPLFDRTATRQIRLVSLAAAGAFVTLWISYRRWSREWFAGLAPPNGLEPIPSVVPDDTGLGWLPAMPSFRFPDAVIPDAFWADAWWQLLLLAAVNAVLATWWVARSRAVLPMRHVILPVMAMTLGLFHQFFAASLVLLAHALVAGPRVRSLRDYVLRPVHVGLGVSFVFWGTVLTTQLAGEWKPITLAVWGFPNVLQHFAYWFANGWPFFLVVVALTGLVMFIHLLGAADRALLFLLGAIVLPIVVASMFQSYEESRYVFHLYPLLVIVFVWGIVRLANPLMRRAEQRGISSRFAFGTILASAFLLSGDVGALTVAPLQRTYSSAREPMRSIISWRAYAGFHQDQEGPSRFVGGHADQADRIAAVGVPHQLAVYRFYTGRLDVALSRAEDASYQRRRDGRYVDWVTGCELVFDPGDLLPKGAPGWILGDHAILRDDVHYFRDAIRDEARALLRDPTMVGRDAVTFAKRFP